MGVILGLGAPCDFDSSSLFRSCSVSRLAPLFQPHLRKLGQEDWGLRGPSSIGFLLAWGFPCLPSPHLLCSLFEAPVAVRIYIFIEFTELTCDQEVQAMGRGVSRDLTAGGSHL